MSVEMIEGCCFYFYSCYYLMGIMGVSIPTNAEVLREADTPAYD